MKQLFHLGLLVAWLGFFAPGLARGQRPQARGLALSKAVNQDTGAKTATGKYCVNWPQTGEMGDPANLIAHWDYIETLPFDGVVIFLPRYQFHNFMSPGVTMTYQQTFDDSRLGELSRLFKRVKHNYLMAWCDKPGDFYDDAAYARAAQNFAVLAKAAKNAGITGVVFDDEQYVQPVWDYPTAVDHSDVYSLAQYRVQARLRGKQVMEAMLAEFPDIEIIVPHGPYWSEPSYNLTPNPIYDEGELLGSFFLGFVEASIAAKNAGHSPKVVDGGELYKPRTVQEFEDSYQWRKRYIASAENNSATIPESFRPLWADNVSVSFGLFNIGNEAPMDPSIMRTTMERATRRCDDVVWLYSERQDWYTPGALSQDWIDAVRDGFQAGLEGTPNPDPGTIANGVYKFTARHSGKTLEIAGGVSATGNGASAQQNTYSGAANQQWQLTYLYNGYYKIIAQHSGKALNVSGAPASIDNGGDVEQYNFVNSNSQQWQLVDVGGGYYKVIARHSGKALDVAGGPAATADGTPVRQWEYGGGLNQQWKVELATIADPNPGAIANGVYKLTARHSGKCLDVAGGPAATADGTPVHQWEYAGGLNQQWRVEGTGGGYYKLTAVHSGKVLDVPGSSLANGTALQQYTDVGSGAQRWKIEATSDGYYKLVNQTSGKVLDVYGGPGSVDNGVLVHQWEYLGGLNQQWKFDLLAARQAAAAPAPAPVAALLSVFPNPSFDGQTSLQIQAAEAQSVTVQVRDQQGQLVSLLTVPAKAGTTVFRVPVALTHGLYFVLAKVDGQVQRFTLQVK